MQEQKVYDSLESLQEYFLKEKPNNIFLVRGRNSYQSSKAKATLERILQKRNTTHFYEFSPNPKLEEAMKGIKLYNQTKPELIIAIGGGSVIDMAKLIKCLADEEDPRESVIQNRIRSSIKQMPFISIPTTSGSGSESTPFAVVYVDGIKYSLEHPALLSSHIILDSTLTYSLSKRQTAASGMDALAQAIESYWSINSTEKSVQYSEKAIQMILSNLERAVNSPNYDSRKAMMQGANLAGKAIAIAKTTSCHSISYPITSNFNVLHGHAVALTLADIFVYNSKVSENTCSDLRGAVYVKEKMKKLTNLLNAGNPEKAREKIKSLMRSIGLETHFSELGINKKDLELIIRQGFNPQRMKNNPRQITENDLRVILQAIY